MFSDPPINTANVIKRAGKFILNDQVSWTADEAHEGLRDGTYVVGIRPHHVTLAGNGSGAVPVAGRVLVTELSGSESVIHFDFGGRTWISQSHGVHAFEVGASAQFYIDIRQCLYFGLDDELIAV